MYWMTAVGLVRQYDPGALASGVERGGAEEGTAEQRSTPHRPSESEPQIDSQQEKRAEVKSVAAPTASTLHWTVRSEQPSRPAL